jgi:ribonuclease HI
MPSDAEILRFLAEQEPLQATLRAFPDLNRDGLREILERAALAADAPPVVGGAAAAPAAAAPAAVAPPSGLTRIRVYSDGAARGNPGPSGAGAVLVESSGKVLERLGKYLGVQTNNYAEYMALLLGLKRAKALGVQEVEVFADSELMIRQLGGRYQVKSPSLRPLYEEVLGLLNEFSRFKLVYVPREMNAAADEMSNRAIDERM